MSPEAAMLRQVSGSRGDGVGLRRLVIVLGDQLDPEGPALSGFDPSQDAIWMAEVPEESTKVWSHQARIALFLAAMRRFAEARRREGKRVIYRALGSHPHHRLAEALAADLRALKPEKAILCEPGEWSVREALLATLKASGIPYEERVDDHFLCSRADFAAFARGRRQLRMEHFYRWLRRQRKVLMEGARPLGGRWNFDAENRKPLPRTGLHLPPPPLAFPPDADTQAVLAEVGRRFAEHPGSLAHFAWPLDRAQALRALADFVKARLPGFGPYQDAMQKDAPWLWHSRLSAAINLKLLRPMEVIAAAEEAYRQGLVPLASAEGFIRQVLGWREYVRGMYWLRMPDFASENALGAEEPLPRFYWDGKTRMRCLAEVIGQTLELGYAHHIQRLMVTGLFALLLGVRPQEVHRWYLAIYVDAVEWVELPNTLGMSQFADGGVLASKPYVASGRYIARMSNYCRFCPFDPARATGAAACPFTTLFWDFLARHRARFGEHPRVGPMWRQLARKSASELAAIRRAADRLREAFQAGRDAHEV